MGFWFFVRKFDWLLVLLILAVIFLASVTFYGISQKDQQILGKEFLFAIAGLILMVAVSFLDYRVFKNYSGPSIFLYVVSIILLAIALASSKIRGVSSWIVFVNLQFQPSEFAKLTLLILLAKYFSQKHAEIYRWHHILASGLYTLVPALLTLFEPDFGSMSIFFFIWAAILFFSGIKRRHIFIIFIIGLVLLSLTWFLVLHGYQKARIISFLNPYLDPRGTGYNTIQAQTTLGSGRLLGNFWKADETPLPVSVPEPYTDFTFSVYGQKFGFLGILALLAITGGIIYRIGLISSSGKNNFARLYGLGLIILILAHVFINAGMNLGLLPITGIPFPFLSYGGSHTITLMAALGLLQSIKIRS